MSASAQDAYGSNALHLAATTDSARAASALLVLPCAVELLASRDGRGRTPLDVATQKARHMVRRAIEARVRTLQSDGSLSAVAPPPPEDTAGAAHGDYGDWGAWWAEVVRDGWSAFEDSYRTLVVGAGGRAATEAEVRLPAMLPAVVRSPGHGGGTSYEGGLTPAADMAVELQMMASSRRGISSGYGHRHEGVTDTP